MQVFYRVRPGHHPITPFVIEQDGHPAPCCEDMRSHWGTLIGFGVKDCPRSGSKEVNIWTRIPQAKGGYVWSVTPICFCPWCGKAVEICRVK